MQNLNVSNRHFCFFIKKISVLLLLLIFQSCPLFPIGQGGVTDPITKAITHKTAVDDLPTQLNELGRVAVSNRIKDILYDLVARNESSKLEKILEFCNINSQSDPDLKGKFSKALRELYVKNKCNRTLLGISIDSCNKNTFDLLLGQEGIDINNAGDRREKYPTSLLLALKKKQLEMVDVLIAKPNIDAHTIDPISGNTTVHLAIYNAWQDYAVRLLRLLLVKHNYGVLFAKNKTNEETILHLSMQYKQENVQKAILRFLEETLQSEDAEDLKEMAREFIVMHNQQGKGALYLAMKWGQKSSQDRLIDLALAYGEEDNELLLKMIESSKGKNVISAGIQYNQESVIKLINHLPLRELCESSGKQGVLLYQAVRQDKFWAFKAIMDRISELAKIDKNKVAEQVKYLFGITKKGKSIWEDIYLSKMLNREPVNSKTNIEMFEYAIRVITKILEPEDWDRIRDAILDDIQNREVMSRINGGISESYADKLRNIVSEWEPLTTEDAAAAA